MDEESSSEKGVEREQKQQEKRWLDRHEGPMEWLLAAGRAIERRHDLLERRCKEESRVKETDRQARA